MSTFRDWKIKEEISLPDNTTLILLEMLSEEAIHTAEKKLSTQNIFRLDNQGCVIWQIQASEAIKGRNSPFTAMFLRENKELEAYRYDGFLYRIDINTGEAEPISFVK